MSVISRFYVNKDKINGKVKYFDYKNLDGYCLTAKEVVHFQDAVEISRLIVINPEFASSIAMKKIEKKFNRLINLIDVICNDDDEESDDSYRLALDEVAKFKSELKTKYRKILKEKEYELLLKKIDILEQELKLRIKYLEYAQEENIEEKGKSR